VKRLDPAFHVKIAQLPTGKGEIRAGWMPWVVRGGATGPAGIAVCGSGWEGGLGLAECRGFPRGPCGRGKARSPISNDEGENGSGTARPCHQDGDGRGRGRKSSKGSPMHSDRAGWREWTKRGRGARWLALEDEGGDGKT
jgi:hypothetical protein